MPALVATSEVVRSQVEKRSSYDLYREDLRKDFLWACAYCSRTEMEVSATGFQIDHHDPQSADGGEDYTNLYWACAKCNRHKSGVVPQPFEASKRRFIRIDLELSIQHLKPAPGNKVAGTTDVGKFHVGVLCVNTAEIRRIRAIRRKAHKSDEVVTAGLRFLQNVNLDMLPPQARGFAVRLREKLANEYTSVQSALYAKNHSLGADQTEPELLKARRKLLKEA